MISIESITAHTPAVDPRSATVPGQCGFEGERSSVISPSPCGEIMP